MVVSSKVSELRFWAGLAGVDVIEGVGNVASQEMAPEGCGIEFTCRLALKKIKEQVHECAKARQTCFIYIIAGGCNGLNYLHYNQSEVNNIIKRAALNYFGSKVKARVTPRLRAVKCKESIERKILITWSASSIVDFASYYEGPLATFNPKLTSRIELTMLCWFVKPTTLDLTDSALSEYSRFKTVEDLEQVKQDLQAVFAKKIEKLRDSEVESVLLHELRHNGLAEDMTIGEFFKENQKSVLQGLQFLIPDGFRDRIQLSFFEFPKDQLKLSSYTVKLSLLRELQNSG